MSVSSPRTALHIAVSLALGAVLTIGLLSSANAEDRTLSMFNIHTKETITVTFKKDGRFVPDALKKLNHFMRDWRTDREITLDPDLVDLIWQLHKDLGSKEPVHLISGYRSPGTNSMLRRTVGGQAKQSRHITGQAADIMFPDVPLKQLRYSALIRERGGVGYYPASGVPFVHVDTGNVRHWPRLPRLELAMLFPSGRTRHVPADGHPITKNEARIALAKWQSSGRELPWVLNKSAARPMLASLNPSDLGVRARPASLNAPAKASEEAASVGGKLAVAAPSLAKPEASPSTSGLNFGSGNADDGAAIPEILLAEEGDEDEDVIEFEPLPATFLLTENPLMVMDDPQQNPRPEIFNKLHLLLSSPSTLASEDFDRRVQFEELYGCRNFAGKAIAALTWRRNRSRLAEASAR